MEEVYGTWEHYLRHRFHDLVALRSPELSTPRIALAGHAMFASHMLRAHERMRELGRACRQPPAAWAAHAWFGGWLPGAVALLDELERGWRQGCVARGGE